MKRGNCRFVLCALALLASAEAHAVERFALVVGIDSYQNLEPLQTARNDATGVADALTRHGFTVTRVLDPTRSELGEKIQQLTGAIKSGDEVVFFFSGHGVAVGGTQYMLPADLPESALSEEALLARSAFAAGDIVGQISDAGARITIAVLDASRDNPLAIPDEPSVAERQLGQPEGEEIFILYSAGAGQQALHAPTSNSDRANSLFTGVLLPYLRDGSLTILEIARQVQVDVEKAAGAIGHDQAPAYYDLTQRDFRLGHRE